MYNWDWENKTRLEIIMKKKLLGLLLGILTIGSVSANTYLKKPAEPFRSGVVFVTGPTSDSQTLTTGAMLINGSSLTVNGAAALQSTLAVTGATTLTGAVTTASTLLTSYKVGTVGAATVSATETPGGKVTLTLTNFVLGTLDTNGTSNNGNVGAALYTFVDNGKDLFTNAYVNIALTTNNGAIQATDTPDVGIGTANTNTEPRKKLLSEITSAENILTGQTATDVNGTAITTAVGSIDLYRDTDQENTLYLNAADEWVSNANGSILYATGTIIIDRVPFQYP